MEPAAIVFFLTVQKEKVFFIAAFQQEDEVKTSRYKEANIQPASAKEKEAVSKLINIEPSLELFTHHEMINIFPEAFLPVLKILSNNLYIRQAGIAAGSFKGKDFVPDHALALSNILNKFPKLALALAEALSYLRKQDIQPAAQQGWYMVTHDDLGLGWVKSMPNRTNNYYPSQWRILKS